ncbi:DsrE family protein [Haladaptatus sp. NG-SE-30]
MKTHSRRRFLQLAGAGTAVALAGCTGESSGTPGTTTGTDTETETETETTTSQETTTETQETTMSTVFHYSSGKDHQKHAVANVANLLDDDSTDVETVALVANGQGIRLVMAGESTVADKVTALAKRGVEFKACQNSMEAFNFSTGDLLAGVETVPAGVGELTKLQADGYAYIKTP